jgi:hypothetical protein
VADTLSAAGLVGGTLVEAALAEAGLAAGALAGVALLVAALLVAALLGVVSLGAALAAGAFAGRAENALRAASSFFRACFAAFFCALNNLRASLSRAFADRTACLAEAALEAAFSAAALSSRVDAIFFMGSVDAGAVAMVLRAGRETKIHECRRLPLDTPHAPSGSRAIRLYTPGPAESPGISAPA